MENVKNTRGDLGLICNGCGGYGFTNNITGATSGCIKCQGSGIEPVDTNELLKELQALKSKVEKLEKLN